MSSCNSCELPLKGGRKRRQIGKRTRKVTRGGGWWDDIKSKFSGSADSGLSASPNWWESIKSKVSESAGQVSSAITPSNAPSAPAMPVTSTTTYGGRKSRNKRRGGRHSCVYEGKGRSKKAGRSRTRSRSHSRSRSRSRS